LRISGGPSFSDSSPFAFLFQCFLLLKTARLSPSWLWGSPFRDIQSDSPSAATLHFFFFQGAQLALASFPIVAVSIPPVIFFISWFLLRLILVLVALYLSFTAIARTFGVEKIEDDRGVIGLFPCGLVYAVLSLIVLMH
jgi:hypothetical protein